MQHLESPQKKRSQSTKPALGESSNNFTSKPQADQNTTAPPESNVTLAYVQGYKNALADAKEQGWKLTVAGPKVTHTAAPPRILELSTETAIYYSDGYNDAKDDVDRECVKASEANVDHHRGIKHCRAKLSAEEKARVKEVEGKMDKLRDDMIALVNKWQRLVGWDEEWSRG